MLEIDLCNRMVQEIKETYNLEEVKALLSSENWITLATAPSKSGDLLFALGRIK